MWMPILSITRLAGARIVESISLINNSFDAVLQVLFSDEVCGKEKPFTIVDSRVNASSNRQEIHVLLLWVDQVKEQDEHVTFITKLEWIILSEGVDILEMNERPYSSP